VREALSFSLDSLNLVSTLANVKLPRVSSPLLSQIPKSLWWSAPPKLGLQDDLTLSALVPQNALPSDLLENVLCGVAFGLGVLGLVVGIVFFIRSQRPCSGGKSLGEGGNQGQECQCGLGGLNVPH